MPESTWIGWRERDSKQQPSQNSLARSGEILLRVQADLGCPDLSEKIFHFAPRPNQFTDSRRPVPKEGRCARHQRGAGCGGRGRAKDDGAVLRTAKSCGSDAPIAGVKSCEKTRGMTVSNKRGHRGEREVSRKTIARG